MILEFETGLVRHLSKFDKLLTEVQFTNLFDTAFEMSTISKYPICQIERNINPDNIYAKVLQYEDETDVARFCVLNLTYVVRLWYEKENVALGKLQKLRFYQKQNPYITAILEDEEFNIGMRIAGTAMQVVKNNDNRQGARRAVETIINVTIPFSEDQEFDLIESAQININNITIKKV